MSGQVSFTYIPPNLRIPLFSVEFDNSQAGANQDIQRAVLIGGTLITQPVAAVYVATVAQAIALFGASSMLARMMAAYRANDPFGEVWCLPIPDPAAGAAATVPVTITGTATGPGTMALYVGGQLAQVGVTSGMTATQVATAAALAVNAVGSLPMGGGSSLGVVTLTSDARNSAQAGLDVRLNYYGAQGSEALPPGLTVAVGAVSGGTGAPDLAGVAAALGSIDYDFVICGYPGSFIADPHDGSQPTGWALGADGLGAQSFMAAQSAEDLADCAAIVWLWSETDSYRPYSEKSLFSAAALRFLALERAMVPGATAANLPMVWWEGFPYGNTDGAQMHREVVAELAADPSNGIVIGNPMMADSNGRGAAWDTATGIQTGGDNQHRDAADNLRFARLAAPVIARAIGPLGRADTLATIRSGIPVVGGPHITHAFRETASTVVLTIAHDAGTDLVVPLLAASGQGFLVMDGGSVSSPGTLRRATACVRVDATHLRLTLASPLSNPSASCRLFYPYGSYSPAGLPAYTGDMGRGNAVTDNFAALVKPAGWDIGADMGSAWNLNFPLAATPAGIVLSDAPG